MPGRPLIRPCRKRLRRVKTMQPADQSAHQALPGQDPADDGTKLRLRLYVAKSTPNSVRAQGNLLAALAAIGDEAAQLGLEVVDVFSQPGRAITDGVIVTPTLIGSGRGRRVILIGDLGNRDRLDGTLRSLIQPD